LGLAKEMKMLITYSSRDEVIITTPEMEPQTLKEYFEESNGRNLEDYDRDIHREAVQIEATLKL
jgi:hypothetical protein